MHVFTFDYETYGEADLPKVGLYRYAKDPATEVLMMAGALNDKPVTWWGDRNNICDVLLDLVKRGDVIFRAWNAAFERIITRDVLGIDIPIERWRCSMVHAYHLGFSGGLAQVGAQIGLPQDKQKLAIGKRLIQRFSKPAPRNHTVSRYTKENRPEEWEEFVEYNKQDVVTEREIALFLDQYPMPEEEWSLYHVDQAINDRGLPVDLHLVGRALALYRDEQHHLLDALRRMTGLPNPRSQPAMLQWLRARGYRDVDLRAESVASAIKYMTNMEPAALEVLKLRQQVARMAGAKWEAYKRMIMEDGRVRGLFQYNGAGRTGRWAGRNIQPHNLHRSPEDQDTRVEVMLCE